MLEIYIYIQQILIIEYRVDLEIDGTFQNNSISNLSTLAYLLVEKHLTFWNWKRQCDYLTWVRVEKSSWYVEHAVNGSPVIRSGNFFSPKNIPDQCL